MKQCLAFLYGRYPEALDAARSAAPLLGAAMATPIEATHHFYYALTLTALYPSASPNEQPELASLLADKLGKLKHWADNCPQNYYNRYALVMAEIAKIEGRQAEAMDLYEQAIQSARDNGFVQQEALAYELAAQFYATRGFDTFAHAYLKNARYAYLRWGAHGKVRELDNSCPQLRDDLSVDARRALADTVEHLDLETVVKVSEAVSSEIVLDKLINTIMLTAIEHAGAERGLLILPRGEEHRIEAEVVTRANEVIVNLRQAAITAADLPESIFRYVLRTKESVLLPDASREGPFIGDEYIRERHARSVLCLPILKQSKLLGMLYLENNLAPHAFTPSRTAVLKLLASEAAISLENARLYRELAEREARIRRLVDANIIGIAIWDFEGRILDANDAYLQMIGYERSDLLSGHLRWKDLTPPQWLEREERFLIPQLKLEGSLAPFEKEYFRKDGSRVPVLLGLATFQDDANQGVAFAVDLTERKHAADAMRSLQTDLAHANRLATMGQLTASIAHEVNQTIGAARNNAHAALHFLAGDSPDLAEGREAIECVVKDTYRAGDIISGIRNQVKKAPSRKLAVNVNEAIDEVIALVRGELSKHRVSIETRLSERLPPVHADRVQLQQVMLNLILNAIEAMTTVGDIARELLISTDLSTDDGVLVTVGDSGPGVVPANRERIFESFFTTKPEGVGIGLSICRSIIESHSGRIWMDGHKPHGAIVSFTLPLHN